MLENALHAVPRQTLPTALEFKELTPKGDAVWALCLQVVFRLMFLVNDDYESWTFHFTSLATSSHGSQGNLWPVVDGDFQPKPVSKSTLPNAFSEALEVLL